MRRSVSFGVAGLGSLMLGLLFTACGGGGDGGGRPDDEGDGGTSGTGTSGGTAGAMTGGTMNGGTAGSAGANGGTAGSAAGSGGSGGTNTCEACTVPAEGCITQEIPTATINDFEGLFITAETPTFGIYGIPLDATGMPMAGDTWWLRYFSGSFAYPGIPEACTGEPAPEYPLTRTDAEGELHVTGTVGTYSGFGIWLGQCIIDMSAYSGVSFLIGGTTGSGTLKFSVHTSANREPDMCLPGKGTCDVATAGSCTPASVVIDVPATPEVITVPFADLTGGSPAAAVDPAQVLQLQWDFDWMDTMTPYEVDVTVDDVILVE